jgi:hypothetical protein
VTAAVPAMVTAAVTVAGDGQALGFGVALVPTAGHAGAPATRLVDHHHLPLYHCS